MKLNNKKTAFTLIELLVVITIMGILAVGGISVYNSQIQKARDSTRITDLTSLQSAIEQFYQDKSTYPKTGKDWLTPEGEGFSVISILPNLVMDPKFDQPCASAGNTNTAQCGYVYTVAKSKSGITDGAYEVSTAFENSGNVESRADDSKDSGNDPARLEMGLDLDLSTASPANTLLKTNNKLTTTDTTSNADTRTLVITRVAGDDGKLAPAVYSK